MGNPAKPFNEDSLIGFIKAISPFDIRTTDKIAKSVYDDMVKKMVEDGILVPEENVKKVTLSGEFLVEWAVRHMSKRLNLSKESIRELIDILGNVYPASGAALILKELSLMDKETSKPTDKLYIISMLNGEIQSVDYNPTYSYRNCACFNSFKSAEFAKEVFSYLGIRFDNIVANGKQKNNKRKNNPSK